MPTPNLIADPSFQAGIAVASDGTVGEDSNGNPLVSFTGEGGSWVTFDLSRPLIANHHYEVTFHGGGTPHNLKGQLLQTAQAQPVTFGSQNLWAEGDYDHTYTVVEPNGQLRVWNYVMSGQPFTVSAPEVYDLDVDA